MKKSSIKNINTDFEQILLLIQEARSRVYTKANAELVLLYFNVGKVVSQKVEAVGWGENTVQELANFIATKQPELSGFNRRGLYRMKQFYETYHIGSECFLLWISINNSKGSLSATQLQSIDNKEDIKVSALPTLLSNLENTKVSPLATQLEVHSNFLTKVLLKQTWTNHLEIFSSIKNGEEILFYTLSRFMD